jgi:hypothetical protein
MAIAGPRIKAKAEGGSQKAEHVKGRWPHVPRVKGRRGGECGGRRKAGPRGWDSLKGASSIPGFVHVARPPPTPICTAGVYDSFTSFGLRRCQLSFEKGAAYPPNVRRYCCVGLFAVNHETEAIRKQHVIQRVIDFPHHQPVELPADESEINVRATFVRGFGA